MAYPISLSMEYPSRLSRGKLILKVLFGWLYVGIPHGIVLGLYGVAVAVVSFIAFWAVLFTGKYPEGMHSFVTGYVRWETRVNSYLLLLHDAYPPFSGDES